jgi:hypothetical protein
MRKTFSKSITLGRLTVSIVYNEILFLYRGENKIFIRKIRFFAKPAARTLLWICGIVLCVVLVGVISSVGPSSTTGEQTKA